MVNFHSSSEKKKLHIIYLGVLMDMWENDVNSNPDQVFKDDDNQKKFTKIVYEYGLVPIYIPK